MNPIFAAALELQAFCREQGWRFCFIGALAVQRWGEPRLTNDVDLTLLTGFGGEERYVDALLERFAARDPGDMVYWAKLHLDIIERFGRFPHRNAILGRKSTPDELAYLANGGFSG